jgi:hypothetical protein
MEQTIMAIVRCDKHIINRRRAKNKYVRRVKPVGYPNTAVICGRKYCKRPGYVWLTDEDIKLIERGKDNLFPHFEMVKIKVQKKLLKLPEEYLKQFEEEST